MYHPFCKHCKYYDEGFNMCNAMKHGDSYLQDLTECPLKQDYFDRMLEIEKIKQSPDCEGCDYRQWNDFFHWVCDLSTNLDNRCFYCKPDCPYHDQGILKEEKE